MPTAEKSTAVTCHPRRASQSAWRPSPAPRSSARPGVIGADDLGDRHVRLNGPQPAALGVALVPAGDVVARRPLAAVVLLVLAGHGPSVADRTRVR